MLSANQFVEELRSLLSIGDRQIRIQIDGDLIFINFINLPQGVGGAGGGAERENNRAMWMTSGFHKDPTIPVERIKLEESVSVFDQHLRGKTGKPEAVAQYLASFINKLAEIPPKYTHTKPPVTSNLKKAIQLIGAGVEVLSSTYDPGDSHSYGELTYEVDTPQGVLEFTGRIDQSGSMEVERFRLGGKEVSSDTDYPDVRVVHYDAGPKAIEEVRRNLNVRILRAVRQWLKEYQKGEGEAGWVSIKECFHLHPITKTCTTGCKAKRISVGDKCPWIGSWDEAKRECPCYMPIPGKRFGG